MNPNRMTRPLLIGLNALLALLVVSTVVWGGSIVSGLRRWQRDRRLHAMLSREWGAAVATSEQLGSGVGSPSLVVFLDYQCPFCRRTFFAIDTLVRLEPDVSIAVHQFPLPIHPAASGAARAAICAQHQGRFREFSSRLFASSEWQVDTDWVKEARGAGVADVTAFRACLTSAQTASELARDVGLGNQLGVEATPFLFTQASFRIGAESSSALRALVSSERTSIRRH